MLTTRVVYDNIDLTKGEADHDQIVQSRAGAEIPGRKEGTKMLKDITSSAAALYDGGWRSDDKEQLIEEYNLTEKEAIALVEQLAEYEQMALK